MTNTLGVSPIPIRTMNNGNNAIDGTFFVAFMIGIIRFLALSHIEHTRAIMFPTMNEIKIPKNTIFSV